MTDTIILKAKTSTKHILAVMQKVGEGGFGVGFGEGFYTGYTSTGTTVKVRATA